MKKLFIALLLLLFSASAWGAFSRGAKRLEDPSHGREPEMMSGPTREFRNHEFQGRVFYLYHITHADLIGALQAWKTDPNEYKALKRILKVAAFGSEIDRALVAAYIRLGYHAYQEFRLRPSDLEHHLLHWGERAKKRLLFVLQESQRRVIDPSPDDNPDEYTDR